MLSIYYAHTNPLFEKYRILMTMILFDFNCLKFVYITHLLFEFYMCAESLHSWSWNTICHPHARGFQYVLSILYRISRLNRWSHISHKKVKTRRYVIHVSLMYMTSLFRVMWQLHLGYEISEEEERTLKANTFMVVKLCRARRKMPRNSTRWCFKIKT